MRVIAGTRKGHRLASPRGAHVRPTGDRVREAIFNLVGPVDGTSVLDLFAGSGALGIEALSRGAAAAALVERSARHCALARENLAAVEIPLMMLYQRAEAADFVRVRVVRDSDQIGVWMEWEDNTVDGSVNTPTSFSDGGAVMFSLTQPSGHFSMGEKDRPCNIWYWRFARQLDMANFRHVETVHPDMVVDSYPAGGAREVGPGGAPITAAPSHDAPFLSGAAAGNSVSQPLPDTAVENLYAVGFGTLTAQPPQKQTVEGRGVWKDGTWRVVFRRSLEGAELNASFTDGVLPQIAFAVWNGSAGDRNGKKLVTFWQDLTSH